MGEPLARVIAALFAVAITLLVLANLLGALRMRWWKRKHRQLVDRRRLEKEPTLLTRIRERRS